MIKMEENPKVFISYSHQDEAYEQRVLAFANKLRSEGIDASIDLYEEAPKEGWPRWMENQIKWADYVIVVASKSYFDKCYGINKGKGISWEVNIVYQLLYDEHAETAKFIPAFFDEGEEEYILTPMKPFTYYNIEKEYKKLYWRLRGVKKNEKPPLGELRPLEEKKQKTTMFLSTPIDVNKWNSARWKGMLYCFSPDKPPVLGLLFKNYAAGVEIFKEWRKKWGEGFADEYLAVNYVVPPYPKDCYVYKEADCSYGKGYFIIIGPNIDAAAKRAIASGVEPEEMLLTTISRNLWVDEVCGSENRHIFTGLVSKMHKYQLIPAGIIDEKKPLEDGNVYLGFEYAINLRNFTAEHGTDVKENDPCKVVFQKAMNFQS